MFFQIPKNLTSERPVALLPHVDSLVEVVACAFWCRNGRKDIVLGGMPLLGAMEGRSVPFAKRCSRWKDVIEKRVQ